jgi:DNA-binding transcriptional LysR family regulator
MRFSLRQLSILAAVARHENVSLAAKELHLSASAVSDAVASLEAQYSIKCFDRVRNRLKLTTQGRTLWREAESLLAHAQSLEAFLSGYDRAGHLKVSASFTIGNHLATLALAPYLKTYPSANVTLDTGSTPKVIDDIVSGRAELGMIEAEVNHPDIELVPWCEDELLLFCASTHPLAHKQRITDSDLLGADWILREPESGARQTFDRFMHDLLPQLRIFLELKHNEAIKNAVSAGLGLGCLSIIALRKDIELGLLVPLKPRKRELRRRFHFVFPKNHRHTQAQQAWMAACREVVAR